MALVSQIITAAEADVILAAYPDWLALDDATKNQHLTTSSNWFVNNYTCDGVDYDNPPAEVEHAVAYAAYEDFLGNLYPSYGTQKGGSVSGTSDKAGSVASSVTYGSPRSIADGSFSYIDDVVKGVCFKTSGQGYKKLIR